ncbi:MAG: DMT family transporter [Calditrichia bacterium]|nr:DMT family transporter [Calditrichia bacterium]
MPTIGIIFALLTAFLFGLQGAYGKKISAKIPPLILAWGSFIFSLPYLFGLLAIEGLPTIIWKDFIWATSVSFILNSFTYYIFYRALQIAPLSHTMPFTAFTPIFLIPVAFIMINELPDLKGVIGIFCVFLGGFSIHLESLNLTKPLKNLKHLSGTLLMILVAFIWSITATAEKVAVLSSSQAFYGAVICTLLSLVYLPLIFKKRNIHFKTIRSKWPQLFILGLISGLMVLTQFTAYKFLLVSYVISFKRAGIIVSVLIGIFFFQEKGALKNIISTLIIILGVFLILI